MNFKVRSTEKEIIDLRALTPEENLSTFRLIALINHFLGGTTVILNHLEKFSKKWPENQTIQILDLGTGISDIPEAILKWAEKKGVEVIIVAYAHERKAPGYWRSRIPGPSRP